VDAFRPHRQISRQGALLILGANVAIAGALWGLCPSALVPSPQEVASAWLEMVLRGSLLYELYVSFITNLEALALSCLLSLGLAWLSILPAMKPLVAFLSRARFFGMTGFVVLFTLLFGGGHGLKVALLTFGISCFFLTSMANVVAEVPQAELDHARTLRMGEWRVAWECIVLGRADQALEVLRQNAAMGWMMLTMVEGVSRSEGGIGTMLLNQNKHFHLASVVALQLTVFAVGIAQDWSLVQLKNALCPYASLGGGSK
jgi:NitT/TauT family transport system permease protein